MMFEGRILQVTEKALEFVRSQIKEHTYLGADTRFVTEPEYPEFAWKELIVNAVAPFRCSPCAEPSVHQALLL